MMVVVMMMIYHYHYYKQPGSSDKVSDLYLETRLGRWMSLQAFYARVEGPSAD